MPVQKQPRIESLFNLPGLTAAQHERFNELMATFFITSGTPFQRIESPFLLEAIQLLRPDATLCNRRKLSDHWVDQVFEKVKGRVDATFSQKEVLGTLCSDGSDNVNKDSITNYNYVTKGLSIFVDSVLDGGSDHDADHVAEEWIRMRESLPFKIVGGVFENTATNKKAWKILQNKYKYDFFQGCHSHAAHLLVKWIFDCPKSEKKSDEEYPFKTMQSFVADLKFATTFFKRNHKFHTQLQTAFRAAEGSHPWLALPGDTRWGSLKNMVDSFKASEDILYNYVRTYGWTSTGTPKQRKAKRRVHDIIVHSDFKELLSVAQKLLEPIDAIIVELQSDDVPLSRAYDLFDRLESRFDDIGLTDTQLDYVREKVRHYWKFVYGDATGLAYLLDPRYSGERCDTTLENELIEFICSFRYDDDENVNAERQGQVRDEVNTFLASTRSDIRNNTSVFQHLQHPKQWWSINQRHFPVLYTLAVKVFAMPASTGSTKRGFSTQKFIHSVARNRLHHSKAKKWFTQKLISSLLKKRRRGRDSI